MKLIFFILCPVLIVSGIVWKLKSNRVKKHFGTINEKVTMETLRNYRKWWMGEFEMDVSTLLVAGGAAVVVAGTIGFMLYKKYSGTSEKLSDLVNQTTDEQLVVDKLRGSDLTPWFRQKNAEKKFKNVILYPDQNNIAKFNLPQNVEEDTGNMLIQALFDESNNKIILSRSVMFESIDNSLEEILKKNDGMIIVE